MTNVNMNNVSVKLTNEIGSSGSSFKVSIALNKEDCCEFPVEGIENALQLFETISDVLGCLRTASIIRE